MSEGSSIYRIVLSSDVKQFIHGFEEAKTKVLEFAAELAGIITAAELVRGFNELNEKIFTLGKVAGVTSEEMAGISYSAQKNGIEISKMSEMLKHFSEYLIKSGRDANNLKEALLEQADIFNKLPDGAQKTALAVQMFGRSGAESVRWLSQSRESLSSDIERGANITGVTDRSVEAIHEFSDKLIDFKLAAESLAGSLEQRLLPTLGAMLTKVTNLILAFRDWQKNSAAPGIFGEGVAVAGGLGVAGLAGKYLNNNFAVGAVRSISDVGEVLMMMGKKALTVVSPIAVIVAGLTALGVAFVEFFKMLSAHRQEVASYARSETELMAKYAQSLRVVIDEQEKQGKLTAERAELLRKLTGSASSVEGLKPVSQELIKNFDQPAKQRLPWTQETLEVANKELDIQREIFDIEIKKNEKANENGALSISILNDISRQEDLIYEKKTNAEDALKDLAISQQQYDEIDLQIRKELLAIDDRREAFLKKQNQETITQLNLQKGYRDLALRGVNENPFSTERGKASQSMPLLKQQKENIQAQVDYQRMIASDRSGNYSESTKIEAQQKLLELANQQYEVEHKMALLQIPDSFRDSFRQAFAEMRTESQVTWQTIAQTFKNTVGGAVNTMSQNFTNVIMKTETWNQALMNIGNTIVSSIINTVVSAALSAAIAWFPAAILSTIASAGSSAGSAPAAVAAALGGMAFAQGGEPPVGQMSLVGEEGPELFVPHIAGTILPAGATRRIMGGGTSGATMSGGQPSDMSGGVHIHNWFSDTEMRNYILKHPDFSHHVNKITAANAHNFLPRKP